MTEFVLFILVGGLAVAFAALMLLSDNAVHSAIYLIGTMFGIAFLFLLLNAPFLAMIQITVYAGAIMVLFLFVIMLLGAERMVPGQFTSATEMNSQPRYRWFIPLAITLTMSLLIASGLAIFSGAIDEQRVPVAAPRVQVVNALADSRIIDVYANDTLIAERLEFGQSTFMDETLPAGAYVIRATGEAGNVILGTTTLNGGTSQALIAYEDADGDPALGYAPLDLGLIERDREGRVTVFNAYSGAASLDFINFVSELEPRDNTLLLDDLEFGEVSPGIEREAEQVTYNFALPDSNVPTSEDSDIDVVATLRDYELERESNVLVVVTGQDVFDGSVRGTAFPVATDTRSSFGGPRAIGLSLFTDYLLPVQLLALLLLAAMVGVIVLTHREIGQVKARVGGRRRVSRPLTSVLAAQVGQEVTEDENASGNGNGSGAHVPAREAETVS